MRERLRDWVSRFWWLVSAVSVRVKILGMALGLVLLLGSGILWQVRAALTRTLQTQAETESITLGRDLAARAADPILLNDLVGLQKLLTETLENNPDLRYAFVVDKYGQVLVHTFGQGFPRALLDANTASAEEHHHIVTLQTEEGLVWDTAVPILEGRVGVMRVGVSDARLRAAVAAVSAQILLMMTLVSALGVLGTVTLTFILTRPLGKLVEATRRVAGGDFSPRVPRWAQDEIGDLAEAFNAMTDELARADELRREREHLRRQLLERVIATQEDERRRIARELHDSTSQNLTSLMVGLKNIEALCDNPRLRSTVDELRGVASQTLDEVHEISARLRPRVLDDLGLPDAIERLVHDWQARHKIPVDVVIHIGQERLPGEVETAIYRIIQESLTNAARYAQARSVSVLVERRGGDVVTVVEDDGHGFDPSRSLGEGHLGLAGMRERAELLGGKLTVESAPGRGTSVHVQIPVISVQ
ncbi:MAG: HAMP domain-containing protein [Chloroflexi bacterium]|nr:HAMP domain-containing protein [Chloroflexota bacterium]